MVALGGLWFARQRVARTRATSLDGAAYLRHVAPALRSAGCATVACHGRAGASLHLSPTLADAADAVREFHDVSGRVRAGDLAGSALWRKATGAEGHPAVLTQWRCETWALKAWIEGRPAWRCR